MRIVMPGQTTGGQIIQTHIMPPMIKQGIIIVVFQFSLHLSNFRMPK